MPSEENISIETLQSYVSVGQIAKALRRRAGSIYRVIDRLNIKPAITLPIGGSRYNPSVLEQIRASMRRPNFNCRLSQSNSQGS